ncbi:unnamed protein product [Soboliphyme baturini]|uniref:Senescence domain-containing protein n=1 Tax=Soboliphyme baturini TaxID=241478 RepID=A0A183II66_9BILA|nr:unnamed protein product [Soboliphyme baturini]
MALENGCQKGNERSISHLYYEAYVCVDKGIHFDQMGNSDAAIAMYRCGLEIIDTAGTLPDVATNELYVKMLKARSAIEERLKFLEHSGGDQATSPPSDIGAVFDGSPPSGIEPPCDSMPRDENAQLLFEIPDGVQIFFITDTETSVPSYPSGLKIFRYNGLCLYVNPTPIMISPQIELHATGFMQIDTWVYPFIVGHSPVLETTYGAYIFPYCNNEVSEVKVGVLLPGDLNKDVLATFEDILQGFTCLRHQTVRPTLTKEEEERFSSKLAKMLVKGRVIVNAICSVFSSMAFRGQHSGQRHPELRGSHVGNDCQRYGKSVADVTDDCLCVAGNAAYTAWNVDQLGVKAIAKRTTAAAGMTAIKQIEKQPKT